jgi:hypothetical protein
MGSGSALSPGGVRGPIPARAYQRPLPLPGQMSGASHEPVTAELRRSGRGFVMLSVRYLLVRLVTQGQRAVDGCFFHVRARDAQEVWLSKHWATVHRPALAAVLVQ